MGSEMREKQLMSPILIMIALKLLLDVMPRDVCIGTSVRKLIIKAYPTIFRNWNLAALIADCPGKSANKMTILNLLIEALWGYIHRNNSKDLLRKLITI